MNEESTLVSVSAGHEKLEKALSRDFTKICQVLILHFTDNNDNATANALR